MDWLGLVAVHQRELGMPCLQELKYREELGLDSATSVGDSLDFLVLAFPSYPAASMVVVERHCSRFVLAAKQDDCSNT